jgi:hypothetical protein
MREPLVKLNKKETEEFESMNEALDRQLEALTATRAKIIRQKSKWWEKLQSQYREKLEGINHLICKDGAIYEYEEEE